MGIFDSLFGKKNSKENHKDENEKLNKVEDNPFNTNDVRKLVNQLLENEPKIILTIEDRYFGVFQLKDDLKKEEFKRIDSDSYEYFDPNKHTYTGTTIFREYECLVSKESLIKYLNEYIESGEFDEEEMDLGSFLDWGHFTHGHWFEQELDSGEIKEIVEVQGKEVYQVSNWEVEEQRSCDLSIKFIE